MLYAALSATVLGKGISLDVALAFPRDESRSCRCRLDILERFLHDSKYESVALKRLHAILVSSSAPHPL